MYKTYEDLVLRFNEAIAFHCEGFHMDELRVTTT